MITARSRYERLTAALGVGLVGLAASAHAQVVELTINVGSQTVIEGSSVTFPINVQNTGNAQADIAGLNFYFEIQGGQTPAPAFGTVDIISGTLFANNNFPQDPVSEPQFVFRGVITSSGTVPLAAGNSALVATVEISAAGVSSGSWNLLLSNPPSGLPTDYFDNAQPFPNSFPMQITDGTLTVTPVPEPELVSVAVGIGLIAFGYLHRRVRTS